MKNIRFYVNSENECKAIERKADEIMKNIATYLNDEIREEAHSYMFFNFTAEEDSPENFLNAYIELAPDEEARKIKEILKNEFNAEWD